MMISDPRQCTVCGPERSAFALISAPSITLCKRGARGSVAVSTICKLFERTPGRIRYFRDMELSSWQLEQAFQPM